MVRNKDKDPQKTTFARKENIGSGQRTDERIHMLQDRIETNNQNMLQDRIETTEKRTRPPDKGFESLHGTAQVLGVNPGLRHIQQDLTEAFGTGRNTGLLETLLDLGGAMNTHQVRGVGLNLLTFAN